MADLPLDQYCAFLEQTNDGTEQESILTQDANLVLESAQKTLLETKYTAEKDTAIGPDSKKIKLEESTSNQQDSQIDSKELENKEDLEEGELEDGEIHKDEEVQSIKMSFLFDSLF